MAAGTSGAQLEPYHGKPRTAAGPVCRKVCGGDKAGASDHGFVFALFVFCGKVFAHLPGLPPVTLPLFLLRGLLGALAVIAAQLVLAMVIRSFAVPIFLGLLGGILGIFAGSKGFSLLWPYALMQAGMNANKSEDALAGSYGMFFLSCAFWLAAMFLLAWGLLRKRDVKA